MSEDNAEIAPEEEITDKPAPRTLEDLTPKMKVKGVVERLELYGAFIDVGVDVNALIHISQLGQERVNRVSDVLAPGDEVVVWVDKVNPERNQLMVTMVEPLNVEWRDLKVGQVYTGTIKRLENFGAFVDIGAEREGLVHISELSHDFVKHPGELLSVGDEVQVKVLSFNRRKRRIDLSIKALLDEPEAEVQTQEQDGKKRRRRPSAGTKREPQYEEMDGDDDAMPTAMEIAMRKAMGDSLPTRGQASQRDRRRSKTRKKQEDILSRTLQLQDDNQG